jgi:hypothetical protein
MLDSNKTLAFGACVMRGRIFAAIAKSLRSRVAVILIQNIHFGRLQHVQISFCAAVE